MRRSGLILSLLICLMAHPALALSCLKPDVVRSYLEAHHSEDRWGAVVGRLHFDESRRPGAVGGSDREGALLRGQFVGYSLSEDGFDEPFQSHVTVQIDCFASWCGHPKSGTRYLAFVKRVGGRHVIISDPCETWLFKNPRRKDLKALHRCFTGGYCQVEED